MIRISLLVGMLLASLILQPVSSVHAQESSDCSQEIIDNPILLDIANYMLTEIERPGFDRVPFVTAMLLYSNRVDLEDTSCSVLASARLLSWAFEVYRIEANYYLKVSDKVEYDKGVIALFNSRAKVYEVYCGLYPLVCVEGVPMSYDDFINLLEPSSTNSPL